MRSEQLIGVMKAVVKADLNSTGSIINFFLSNEYTGGWEAWLQVVYAKGVYDAALNVGDFKREQTFPNSVLRCDLVFLGQRGAPVWIELKTQRNKSYKTAFNDFLTDVTKLKAQGNVFLTYNVTAALVLLVTQAGDPAAMATWAKSVSGVVDKANFYAWDVGTSDWVDVSTTLNQLPTGVLVIAAWRGA